MYRLFGFAKNLNSANTLNEQNCVNSTRNFVRQMHKFFGFAKNLNIQNCVNSTSNYVHQMYGLTGFVKNLESCRYVECT